MGMDVFKKFLSLLNYTHSQFDFYSIMSVNFTSNNIIHTKKHLFASELDKNNGKKRNSIQISPDSFIKSDTFDSILENLNGLIKT